MKKLIPFLIHNSIFLILAVTIYILLPAPPVQAGCCERNSGPDTSCCSEINEDACSSPGSNYVSMSCAAYRTASETDCPTCPPTGPTTGGCCISQATAGATASCVYDFYTTTGCVDLHASDYYKTWHPNDECSLFQICPQSVPSSTGCITATRCPTGKTQGDGPCPEGQIVCVPDSSTPPTSAPLKLPNPLGTDSVPKIVGRIIKILTGGAGMIAFLMFVYGGFQWLTAMGNPEKIKKGKDIILWSILGLVVMMSAYIVTNYIIKALLPAAF